jgi:hypothetical protein
MLKDSIYGRLTVIYVFRRCVLKSMKLGMEQLLSDAFCLGGIPSWSGAREPFIIGVTKMALAALTAAA